LRAAKRQGRRERACKKFSTDGPFWGIQRFALVSETALGRSLGDEITSTMPVRRTRPAHARGGTALRPPLRTEGAFSSWPEEPGCSSDLTPRRAASLGWISSEAAQPTDASIARRACLSSASLYWRSKSLRLASPRGSKPCDRKKTRTRRADFRICIPGDPVQDTKGSPSPSACGMRVAMSAVSGCSREKRRTLKAKQQRAAAGPPCCRAWCWS